MAKTRVFVSFDYDNDSDLKTLLIGQAKNSDSPFEVVDMSIKEASPDWRSRARRRIKGVDQVVVLCGHHTHTATGVSAEVSIAQEEGKSYFLLRGRATGTCTRPTSAKSTDKMYNWTWDNLKLLIGGSR
ncbi:MAG TPA: TIR domain-containing protein [Mycobacteriales bacterium]